MSPRILIAAAILAASALAARAGPAELPPEGFAGDRYVDSRGCAFQRAEIAGQTAWAAVLDAARAPLCRAEWAVDPEVARAGAGLPEVAADAGADGALAAAPGSVATGTVAAQPDAAVGPAAAPMQASEPETASGAGQAPAADQGEKEASAPARTAGSFVQIGAYGSRVRAVAVMELAQEAGWPARVRAAQGRSAGLSLVRLGPFRDERQLRYALAWARAAGFPDAYRVP